MNRGKVWFIGAGPGDPELLTMKGHRLIAEADLVIYAGSLVPPQVVAHARPDARVLDSATMTLEETHAHMRQCALAGGMVARVHTGDPALYGAVREQADLLRADGIPFAMVPGITAAFAAASAACVSLTVPEEVQSFAITRAQGRTPMPEGQGIRQMAAHGGSLAVYLSAELAHTVREELLAARLSPQTPVLLAHRVGWPEEQLAWSTVDRLAADAESLGFTRQTLFLVLPGQSRKEPPVSRLYAEDFSHGFREEKG